MSSFSLIVSIFPHDKGEKLTEAAVKAGCGGGTVLMGRALAKSNLGAILGVGETTNDLFYTVVASEKKTPIIQAIKDAACQEKSNFGNVFTVNVDNLLKIGTIYGEDKMNERNALKKSHDLITVIVNKGYADDVMFAARKAGARGGTVINARGTAREGDEKFFGVHIVPEKDMLLIIVEGEKRDAVLSSIKELRCLKEPGMGIAFSSPVDDFALLGRKKS